MVLAQLQLVSLLVWLPLDQESVKVMQLPIQWKPLDDNLMQKPKYVACCFFTHYLMDVMLTVADIVALCEMNNLDARGVFLLCSPNKLLTMEHAVVRYAGRCQHQMVYPRLLPPQVELVGTSPSSSRYEEDGLRLLVLPIVGARIPGRYCHWASRSYLIRDTYLGYSKGVVSRGAAKNILDRSLR